MKSPIQHNYRDYNVFTCKSMLSKHQILKFKKKNKCGSDYIDVNGTLT